MAVELQKFSSIVNVEEQKKLINSQQEQINELKNLIQSLIEKNG